MIVLDIDCIDAENSVLVIKHPTGVSYEMQCGGMSCEQKQVEGFAVPIGDFGQDFDCCSFGCDNIGYSRDMQNSMLKAFEQYILSEGAFYRNSFKIHWAAIQEAREGAIPLLFSGKLWGSDEFKNAPCILYTANCD